MTTGPVNINQTVTDVGTRTLIRQDGSSSSNAWNSPVLSRRYDQRPISHSNPLSNGWRSAWPYFRTIGKQDSSFGTVIEQWTGGTLPGNPVVRRIWDRDSFWVTNSWPLSYGTPPSNLENRALIAALNKLKGNDVNIGVALAEAKQTASLLVNGVKSIAKAAKTYRSRYPDDWINVRKFQRGGVHDWRKIPRKWLELQYGWKPLMSDIAGACNALERTWNTKYPVIGVQGNASAYDSLYRTNNGQNGSSRLERADYLYGYKVCLYFQLTNSWLAQFNALGLINPALIVWERVPYSFVVDWFLPVGGWLSALDADFGYSFKGGSGTSWTKGRARIVKTDLQPAGLGWEIYGSGGQVNSTYNVMNRKRYTSTPVPGLYFKNPISAGHIANALALLSSAFRY